MVASIDTTSRLRQQVASTALRRTGGGEGGAAEREIVVFTQSLYKYNYRQVNAGLCIRGASLPALGARAMGLGEIWMIVSWIVIIAGVVLALRYFVGAQQHLGP
jgi:hypothetical protein